MGMDRFMEAQLEQPYIIKLQGQRIRDLEAAVLDLYEKWDKPHDLHDNTIALCEELKQRKIARG